MTASTFIIPVDETTDSGTRLILRDPNNTARNITTNTSGQILYDNAALATVSAVNANTNALGALIALKQDILTAGTGVFLSGTTLTGYDLRWSTNSTSTATIECLRFENLAVTDNINISSGQTELKSRTSCITSHINDNWSADTTG